MVTLEYDVGGCGALLNIAIHPPLPALISTRVHTSCAAAQLSGSAASHRSLSPKASERDEQEGLFCLNLRTKMFFDKKCQ
jgi:hypothetical protein